MARLVERQPPRRVCLAVRLEFHPRARGEDAGDLMVAHPLARARSRTGSNPPRPLEQPPPETSVIRCRAGSRARLGDRRPAASAPAPALAPHRMGHRPAIDRSRTRITGLSLSSREARPALRAAARARYQLGAELRSVPLAAREAPEGDESYQDDDEPDPKAPDDHQDDPDDDDDAAEGYTRDSTTITRSSHAFLLRVGLLSSALLPLPRLTQPWSYTRQGWEAGSVCPARRALPRRPSGCLLPWRHGFESLRAIEEDLAPGDAPVSECPQVRSSAHGPCGCRSATPRPAHAAPAQRARRRGRRRDGPALAPPPPDGPPAERGGVLAQRDPSHPRPKRLDREYNVPIFPLALSGNDANSVVLGSWPGVRFLRPGTDA
jgi:hypothetical protein